MNKSRIVALDYGLKRIGVAISDENKILASPLHFIETGKNFLETIERLLKCFQGYQIERMIIGNPLHLDGRAGTLSEEILRFLDLLKQHVTYPVSLWDERLSTKQVERTMREGNRSRKQRSKKIDSLAAVVLLQSYLGY